MSGDIRIKLDDWLEVATGGTVPRGDHCVTCRQPMLFRVDEAERVICSFCGSSSCPAFLLEIPA